MGLPFYTAGWAILYSTNVEKVKKTAVPEQNKLNDGKTDNNMPAEKPVITPMTVHIPGAEAAAPGGAPGGAPTGEEDKSEIAAGGQSEQQLIVTASEKEIRHLTGGQSDEEDAEMNARLQELEREKKKRQAKIQRMKRQMEIRKQELELDQIKKEEKEMEELQRQLTLPPPVVSPLKQKQETQVKAEKPQKTTPKKNKKSKKGKGENDHKNEQLNINHENPQMGAVKLQTCENNALNVEHQEVLKSNNITLMPTIGDLRKTLADTVGGQIKANSLQELVNFKEQITNVKPVISGHAKKVIEKAETSDSSSDSSSSSASSDSSDDEKPEIDSDYERRRKLSNNKTPAKKGKKKSKKSKKSKKKTSGLYDKPPW